MNPKIYTILSKLLHTSENLKTYPQINVPNFSDDIKMDFYLRKVFKASGIKYNYYRKDRRLIINNETCPFRLYMLFDDYGVTIHPIPQNGISYFFQSSYPSHLINKMVQKKIITEREAKKIIVPIEIKCLEPQLI